MLLKYDKNFRHVVLLVFGSILMMTVFCACDQPIDMFNFLSIQYKGVSLNGSTNEVSASDISNNSIETMLSTTGVQFLDDKWDVITGSFSSESDVDHYMIVNTPNSGNGILRTFLFDEESPSWHFFVLSDDWDTPVADPPVRIFEVNFEGAIDNTIESFSNKGEFTVKDTTQKLIIQITATQDIYAAGKRLYWLCFQQSL